MKTMAFLMSRMSRLLLSVFLLFPALRSFCLDAKRTKKIKGPPDRSARWAPSAQHLSAHLIRVYDRQVVLSVPFPTVGEES
jgi:hypothetical protein